MKTLISFASFSDELSKIAASSKIPLSKAEDRIFRELMKKSPVKVKITQDAAQFGGGYFDQVKKEIGISEKDFKVLAHEVGHAEIDQHILGRMIQSRLARLLSHSSVGGALSATGAGLLMAKGKKWGLLLPAALSVPTLLSEALASHKGGKLIDEIGSTKKQRKEYDRLMRRGFGTYLITPALNTASATMISSGISQRQS